jgi:hypothetical protein
MRNHLTNIALYSCWTLCLYLIIFSKLAGASEPLNTGILDERGLVKDMIIHGYYCGLGMKTPDEERKLYQPRDIVDAMCLQHDYCYHIIERGHCLCDEALTKQADYVMRNKDLTFKQKSVVRAIKKIFSRKSCRAQRASY